MKAIHKCDRDPGDSSVKQCKYVRKIDGVRLCAKIPLPIPVHKNMLWEDLACWLDVDQGDG